MSNSNTCPLSQDLPPIEVRTESKLEEYELLHVTKTGLKNYTPRSVFGYFRLSTGRQIIFDGPIPPADRRYIEMFVRENKLQTEATHDGGLRIIRHVTKRVVSLEVFPCFLDFALNSQLKECSQEISFRECSFGI